MASTVFNAIAGAVSASRMAEMNSSLALEQLQSPVASQLLQLSEVIDQAIDRQQISGKSKAVGMRLAVGSSESRVSMHSLDTDRNGI